MCAWFLNFSLGNVAALLILYACYHHTFLLKKLMGQNLRSHLPMKLTYRWCSPFFLVHSLCWMVDYSYHLVIRNVFQDIDTENDRRWGHVEGMRCREGPGIFSQLQICSMYSIKKGLRQRTELGNTYWPSQWYRKGDIKLAEEKTTNVSVSKHSVAA